MTQRKEKKKYFSKKNKDKSSLKSSQVECFNYREKRHFASNCSIPKKKKNLCKWLRVILSLMIIDP